MMDILLFLRAWDYAVYPIYQGARLLLDYTFPNNPNVPFPRKSLFIILFLIQVSNEPIYLGIKEFKGICKHFILYCTKNNYPYHQRRKKKLPNFLCPHDSLWNGKAMEWSRLVMISMYWNWEKLIFVHLASTHIWPWRSTHELYYNIPLKRPYTNLNSFKISST